MPTAATHRMEDAELDALQCAGDELAATCREELQRRSLGPDPERPWLTGNDWYTAHVIRDRVVAVRKAWAVYTARG